jgi:hypothetical protein
MDSRVDVMMLAVTLNSDYIGRYNWRDTGEYNRMLKAGSFKGSSLVLVGASHTLTDIYFRILLDLNPHTKIRQHGCFISVSIKKVT